MKDGCVGAEATYCIYTELIYLQNSFESKPLPQLLNNLDPHWVSNFGDFETFLRRYFG